LTKSISGINLVLKEEMYSYPERAILMIKVIYKRILSSSDSLKESGGDFLLCSYSHIEFRIRRLICRIVGCKVKGGYGGFNLPDEAYSYYCDRCYAGESNYEGDTYHDIIWEGVIKYISRRIK
jgi:hypothetical protein